MPLYRNAQLGPNNSLALTLQSPDPVFGDWLQDQDNVRVNVSTVCPRTSCLWI